MTYQTEFPDFPAADMPSDIPADFADSSWRNEICPSFTIWENMDSPVFQWAKLWIDYADSALREFQDGKRFLIQLIDEDGRVSPADIWQSDDWNSTRQFAEFLRDNIGDILQLSRYFSALIRAEYTESELQEANARNRSAAYTAACASHDFRDSNSYMYGAFCALYFAEPDLNSESDCGKMNAAWDISRAMGFGN